MDTSNRDSDLKIIEDLKKGDDQAMEMIYRLHWRALYVSAYKVLKDKEACEDIIQELFIRIWNNREQLEITTSIRAYLSAATRYDVYRKIKEVKRFEPIVDEMVNTFSNYNASDSLECRDLQLQVNSIIEKLSPKCKDVYILSRKEQLSHKEIAGKLNISTKTVRNHLTRALHQLRISLHQYILVFLLLLIRL